MSVRGIRRQEGTVRSPAGETALAPHQRDPWKGRVLGFVYRVPTDKLKNMQSCEFIQKFRHSWSITENYFENIQ